MPDTSARLGLPYLQGGQAQKHVTHNEALERLDMLVQLTVAAFGAETPPASPEEGEVWALGPAPTGDWTGKGGQLAAWANGGWLFVDPQAGWRAASGTDLRVWDGAGWVAADLPELADLPGVGIGAGFDPVNRLTVAAEATLLTHAGASHRLKLNKASPGDTASVLFQTGFSGRAEMGTAGTDDFSFKVSPDGSSWTTSIALNRTTGAVSFPSGVVSGPIARAALADGAGLSVIGRSANTSGAVADIAAGTDGHVLRRAGTALGFGTLASGAFADNTIAPARLTNFAGLTVLGRSANSTGAAATIAAGTDHQVLRRSGTALGFGAIALDQAAAVTNQLQIANGGTGAATAAGARTNLGLGTAAVADVTTSPTDATAGRVLRVGDSATVLSASPALRATYGGTADAFTLTSGAGISGTPPTGLRLRFRATAANTGAATLALDGGTPVACRTVTGVALPSGYIRTDIDTDATFDGTFWVLDREPERGSNSNGNFTRFDNGLLVCEHKVTLSNGITTGYFGGFRSLEQTWVFPAAFIAEPAPTGSNKSLTSFGFTIGTVTETQTTWVFTSVASRTTDSRSVGLLAFGYWY